MRTPRPLPSAIAAAASSGLGQGTPSSWLAAALILHALVFGVDRLRKAIPPAIVEIGIALGALLYGGVGLLSMWRGSEFLDYDPLDGHDAVHGQHLGILLVELGVGITVTFVMVAIFYSFAGRSKR